MNNLEVYRVLVLGDLHYGESYKRAGAPILQEYGYSHSTVNLRAFVAASDMFVANLETPLVDPSGCPSPLAGKKSYIHWADPVGSGAALKDLGVDAVSLANNHTLDHGVDGLHSTFETLIELNIPWFGAGRNIEEAHAPYSIPLPERVGGGELHFHGSFQYTSRDDKEYGFYADRESAGCAPLKVFDVPAARATHTREDSFHIAFPHWGGNYKWRTPGQYRLAHRFLKKDYDLVLGHGGHSLQEIHRKQQRWVVYGIGNGVFNSGGRWKKYEEENGILPFSFWSILEVCRQGEHRWMSLKLYPVYSANSDTGFQPGPVSSADFERAVATLASRPIRPWRFDNPAQSTGVDDLGHYLLLDLGEWNIAERPSRLEPALEGNDPGDWPLRSPGVDIEDRILKLNKFLGTSIIVIGAEADGARAHWVAPRIACIEARGKRLLAQSYRVNESSLGAAIVKDKVLTAEFLENSGVQTPKTRVVVDAEEAIEVAAGIPGPVVIKPKNGRKSRGVSTGLLQDSEIREAFDRARRYGPEVLVQQHIDVDQELRVMASPQRAVAVNGRVLPHVIGDGMSTIAQLIEDKNLQRTLNPSLVNRPIPIDDLTRRQLERSGVTLDSVPALGERITVRDVAGLSVGGDTKQILEDCDDAVKDVAAAAVAAIPGLDWGGVDLIIERQTGEPYVIEINTEASYGAALFPAYGHPRDLAAEVWKLRVEATALAVQGEPGITPPNKRPRPVHENAERVAFKKLLWGSLERHQYTIEPLSPQVLAVATPQGKKTFLTSTGLSATDRSVVGNVLKSHVWVRKLLKIAEVPLPRFTNVRSRRELERFVNGRVAQVVCAPQAAAWGASSAVLLTEQEVMAGLQEKPLPKKIWVQSRLRGVRMRVLATPERSWVVTADLRDRVRRRELIAASRMAVRAVRAIPELGWAAVDILVRPGRFRFGEPKRVVVEGLSRSPEYSSNDFIIAGDFDEFSQFIIHSSLNSDK